jgi:hypothetical protein
MHTSIKLKRAMIELMPALDELMQALIELPVTSSSIELIKRAIIKLICAHQLNYFVHQLN